MYGYVSARAVPWPAVVTFRQIDDISGHMSNPRTRAARPGRPVPAALGELGIRDEDLTTEQDTDAVVRGRA
jgi:hypothetical protein